MWYKLKRIMMRVNNTTRWLPAEYQEVEYIESSWTQYITTSIVPSDTKWIYIKLSSQDVNNDLIYVWSRNSTDTRFRIGNSWYSLYIGWNTNDFYNNISTNTIYEVKLNYLNSRKKECNWTTVSSSIWTLSSSNNVPIAIFAWNENWTIITPSKIKLYLCQITDSNSIVNDFVPCYRKADGEAWLYDLVNDQFYTNSWTWTFTKWSDVPNMVEKQVRPSGRLPSAYQEVEYIESSWTQYIDTWWTPSSNYCKTVMDATIYTGNSDWSVYYWMTNWSSAYSLHTNHSTRQLNVGSDVNKNTWISFSNWTNWTFTFEANNGSISVDIAGSTYTGSYSWSVSQSTRPFYIFAFDENWSITWKAKMRVNSFKIYSDANTIERDLVPCYRIADGVIWMYDLVGETFYTNSWTWTFTKWPDV